MAFKKVLVTLHHIKNDNTGPDPGEALEIFGQLAVGKLAFNPVIGQTVSTDVKLLFDHASGDALDIIQGSAFVFPPAHRHELTIRDGQFLQITGRLGEQDDIGPNDFFPNIDIRKSLVNIVDEQFDIPSDESDQRISIRMSTVVMESG
jgi:hypothetical protein